MLAENESSDILVLTATKVNEFYFGKVDKMVQKLLAQSNCVTMPCMMEM